MPQFPCKPPIGIPNALPKRSTVSRVERIACLGSCGIKTTRWGVGTKIAPGERRWSMGKRMEWTGGQQQHCWKRGFGTKTKTNSTISSSTEFKGTPKRSNAAGALAILFGASAVAVLAAPVASYVQERIDAIKHIDAEEQVEFDDVEESNDVAHKFRLEKVCKHDQHADRKWVISGTSVYDITDFVDCHPGGRVILRACGGSIDPYWKLFSIHQKPEVRKVLEDFYIGEIDEKDLKDDGSIDWSVVGLDASAVDDPFKDDPERCADLNILTAKPCNAETPGRLLADFITPLRLFFVRNHLWVPKIEPEEHALQIELSDGEEISFSLEDLKTKFKQHSITVTLQCAGNRRSHMNDCSNGKTSGIAWDVGAIGTAEFTGVRLRDVLLASGYDVDNAAARATTSDSSEEDSSADRHIHLCAPSDTYEQSIPLTTALSPTSDVLLAWEMNSAPLPRDHGGPLRAIVPGTIATRSVKWLGKIRLSPDESDSNWHTRDYKLFGPEKRCAKDATEQDWQEAEAIHDCPVQSAITAISPSETSGSYAVSGFAYSGGGRRILRVDVSADGGKSWKAAMLRKDDEAKGSKRWAWTRWEIEMPRNEKNEEGKATEFVVKATDESCNCQPETFEGSWNFRGLLGNAWHRVKIEEVGEMGKTT